MTDYLVTWDINVTAESPEEAARQALAIQRDAESTATIFEVRSANAMDLIDLEEIDA